MPRRKEINLDIIKASENIDIQSFRESIRGIFQDIEDPRRPGQIIYPMWYLLLIILSGYLSGCNTLADIEAFSRHRHKWLVGLTGVTLQSPSYDTFWMLLVRLEPGGMKGLLQKWFSSLSKDLKGKVLALDGKRVCGATYLNNIVHLVELVVTDSGITIMQERVPSKKGEYSALGPILDQINVEGAILTMDALYTTTKVADLIHSKNAYYILALKGNQGNLYGETQNFFDQAREVEAHEAGINRYQEVRTGHGRQETVTVSVCQDLSWLPQREKWPGLESLVEVATFRNGHKCETRCYISSCKGTAQEFAAWIRSHWAIENNVHWVADVVFREDASKASIGNIQENMALFRRLSMNIVRQYDPGVGMADARRTCVYCEDYLQGLLANLFGKSF